MKRYDYAILGGGASGLSLAHALLNSSLGKRSILLIEKEAKNQNDRTWCFWTDQPSPFDTIRYQHWEALYFVCRSGQMRLNLPPYRYQMLRGIDFYQHIGQVLANHSNVTVLLGEAGDVKSNTGPGATAPAQVAVDGEWYAANWVFDSRFNPQWLEGGKYMTLLQHFLGWEVETERDCFDPQAATLFDLRAPQPEGLAFYYVLPFSSRRALVEYTLFSKSRLPDEAYRQALRTYLDDILSARPYRVIDEESGVIPMTDQPFPRRLGARWLAIGTRGGRVKPSSGYAFARIQRDTAAIVRSLERRGHPFDLPAASSRHRLYDALLLDLLARSDPSLRRVFSDLFEHNPVQQVFRFLDEDTTLLEEIRILASLPARPFIQALLRRLTGAQREPVSQTRLSDE